jgi:hypothetical protein
MSVIGRPLVWLTLLTLVIGWVPKVFDGVETEHWNFINISFVSPLVWLTLLDLVIGWVPKGFDGIETGHWSFINISFVRHHVFPRIISRIHDNLFTSNRQAITTNLTYVIFTCEHCSTHCLNANFSKCPLAMCAFAILKKWSPKNERHFCVDVHIRALRNRHRHSNSWFSQECYPLFSPSSLPFGRLVVSTWVYERGLCY